MGMGFQAELVVEERDVAVEDSSSRTARYGLLSVCVLGLVGLGFAYTGRASSLVESVLDTEKDPSNPSTSGKHGFGVYKYTVPVAAGRANNITRLVNATLCPTLED